MNSIVFIETNKYGSSIEGIKSAKMLGYYIHLITTRRQFFEQGFPEVDEIHLISVLEENILVQKIEKIREVQDIDIIISFIDPFVSLAAKLHNIFCNQNISQDAFGVMEDKILTRKYLQYKPNSPYYFILKKDELVKNLLSQIKQKYPLILKSPVSTGSKDVYLIHTENQMKNRINYLRRKNSEIDLLIEEYLVGPQFIVEAIVYDGNIQIVAVIEQEIRKQNKFIVTGYSISSEMEDSIYTSITDVTHRVLNVLGLRNGNCHFEMRLVNGDWKLIEINPRISGGAMNRLIEEAYGFNYAEQILKVYRGDQLTLDRKYENCIYAHFLTVDSIGGLIKVSGIDKAKGEPGIKEVFIKAKEGQILSPPLSMGHRYGYVIARGQTKEDAKEFALQAAHHIQFHLSSISD